MLLQPGNNLYLLRVSLFPLPLTGSTLKNQAEGEGVQGTPQQQPEERPQAQLSMWLCNLFLKNIL